MDATNKLNMENKDIISFNVKEQSLQEFADKYFVSQPQDDRRGPDSGELNPYYILGKDQIVVRKSIMDVIENDPCITFELFDESKLSRTRLVNTYIYSIEPYDDMSLLLDLIDFKVDIRK